MEFSVHTLKFTDEQMAILEKALVELPFKIAQPLIGSINAQLAAVAEADAAAAKAVEDADAAVEAKKKEKPTT